MDEWVASRHIAPMLAAEGHLAHVQADTFGTGCKDTEWLPKVGANGWVLLTKDKNIRKRPLELRALLSGNVRAFVLTSGSLTGDDQARVFREALPAILRLVRRHEPPFIARVTAESVVQLIKTHRYLD